MTSLGDFELLEEIGRGGMGVVYRGRQRSLDRVVALKILPPELARDAQVAERFMAEARKMARVEHPNVAQIFAVGEEQGQQYMAMQFLPGGTLDDRLLRGPLPPRSAVTVAIQVADALEAAHGHGIIHRDIKPANIMFDAQGQAVVTDFGIAKAGDEVRKTRTGLAVGTPQYMAPEQARGNPVDERADVYALGVVLYEMVCGRPPFEGETPVSVAMKHVTETPLPPQVHCPSLEPWLGSIILKAMAKEPADWFGSAAEMAAALRSGQPVYVPAPAAVSPAYGTPTYSAHVPTTYQPVVPPQPQPFPVWALIALIAAVGIAIIGGAVVFAKHGGDQSANKVVDGGSGGATNSVTTDTSSNNINIPKPTAVSVPNVVGKTPAAAEAELGATGFVPHYNEDRFNSTYAAGLICSQGTEPGKPVQAGDMVYLVKSRGPQPQEEGSDEPLPDNSAEGACVSVVQRFHAAVEQHSCSAASACFTSGAHNRPDCSTFSDPKAYGNTVQSSPQNFRGFSQSGDTATVVCTIVYRDRDGTGGIADHRYRFVRNGSSWIISSMGKP